MVNSSLVGLSVKLGGMLDARLDSTCGVTFDGMKLLVAVRCHELSAFVGESYRNRLSMLWPSSSFLKVQKWWSLLKSNSHENLL